MWAAVVAAVTVVQSSDSGSGSGSGNPARAQQPCSNYESYWVAFNDESGLTNSNLNALCVPTAAGNLITHLAAKTNQTVAYPYNYELDAYNSATDAYELRSTPPQGPTEYYLGGQRFAIIDGVDRSDLDLTVLMKWLPHTGTRIEDARTGLQQYLDATSRLGTVRVVGANRSQATNDVDFLTAYQPPYLLHIAPQCMKENDYTSSEPAVVLKDGGAPLANFHGSTLGHTIAVYRQTQSGSTLELTGASGLGQSRNADNERGCDATTTTVVSDQTCVVGITYIESVGDDGLSTGEIAGIVVGVVGLLALAGTGYYCLKKKGVVTGNMAYSQFV